MSKYKTRPQLQCRSCRLGQIQDLRINTLSTRRKLDQLHIILLIPRGGTRDISRQLDDTPSVLTIKVSRFPLCPSPCLESLNLNRLELPSCRLYGLRRRADDLNFGIAPAFATPRVGGLIPIAPGASWSKWKVQRLKF